MKMVLIDKKYGCFGVKCKCSKCGKVNKNIDLSFNNDKVGIGEVDKIKGIVVERFVEEEHFYCIRCGNKIL